MKKLAAKGFKKFARLFDRAAATLNSDENSVRNDIQYQRCIPWFKANGDKTLRLNYNLDESSIVVDLGGYEGQWSSDIFNKYNCSMLVFEPYKVYAENIRKRFSRNPKVRIFEFGLSGRTQTLMMSISQDASSLFKRGSENVQIDLKCGAEFFKEQQIDRIDLMKINIEGGEYDLLDHLIVSGFIQNIHNVQVQFHDFVPDAKLRMEKIQRELSRTHLITYQFEFVWENWKLVT